MKKSKIMFLSGAGFIFLAILALTIFFRLQVDGFIKSSGDSSASIEASGILESKNYDFQNFEELYFENLWDVSVVEGDKYSITIEADQALFDVISVDKVGKSLRFSYDKYIRGTTSFEDDVRVTISMPDLEEIVFTGMGNIELKDFDLDRLKINNSGASNIEAENVTIGELHLVVNGAANAELENIEIKNCELDISGAANISLKMTGGRLTGQISGAASVSYSGTVSEESVRVSGIGTLDKK